MSDHPTYHCPHCGYDLSSEDGQLIELCGWLHAPDFSVRTSFKLLSKLGQYGSLLGDNIQLREGARVAFECASDDCRHGLTSSVHPDLCAVELREGGETFTVLFSKIFGQHATFKLDAAGETLLSSHGLHAAQYEEALASLARPPQE